MNQERHQPQFVDSSTVELYRASADDLDVARAAWVSQDEAAHAKEAEAGRVEGLIRFLWRNQHTSPFEHGQFTFIVTTPLFVAREFMRHRTFSFNEISGRYTVLPDRFYLPPPHRPLRQEGRSERTDSSSAHLTRSRWRATRSSRARSRPMRRT